MVGQWKAKSKKGGRRIDDIISFTDIAPTFLDAAGIPPSPTMTGCSFLDVFLTDKEGQIDIQKTATYFGKEKHDPGREGDLGYPVRCVRNHQYLYIRNFEPTRWPAGNPETGFTNCDYSPTKRKVIELNEQGISKYYDLAFGKPPLEELYDIREDPECLQNLALKSDYKELKDSMWKQLKAFLIESGDPRLTVSPDYFDTMETTMDGFSGSWKALEEGRWELAHFCRFDW